MYISSLSSYELARRFGPCLMGLALLIGASYSLPKLSSHAIVHISDPADSLSLPLSAEK